MGKPTFFVLTYATDPITTTFVSYEFAKTLQSHTPISYNWVLSEPAWTLADYSTQCQNDANTRGAFVIYDVENDNGVNNFFLVQGSFVHLFARVLFISCSKFNSALAPDGQGIVTAQTSITATGSAPTPPPLGKGVDFTKSPEPTRTDTVKYTPAYPIYDPEQSQRALAFAAAPQGVNTTTFAALPAMKVMWVSDVKGLSHPLKGLVFAAGATVAAVGAYLSTRQVSQTNTVTQTGPLFPGTPTANGSVAYTNTQTNSNSLLPFGVALLGGALTPLSSLTLGAANQTSLLKQAAQRMSAEMWTHLQTDKQGCAPQDDTLCQYFFAGEKK